MTEHLLMGLQLPFTIRAGVIEQTAHVRLDVVNPFTAETALVSIHASQNNLSTEVLSVMAC